MTQPSYDPAQPYGPLIQTRVRLVTWNVWGKSGPWRERQAAIEGVLADVNPDLVALQESWAGQGGQSQAALLGGRLGLSHAVSSGRLPCAVLSRWPILRHVEHALPGGEMPGTALLTEIDGPRGPIHLASVIIGSFRLDESEVRQQQVRSLAEFVAASTRRGSPTLVWAPVIRSVASSSAPARRPPRTITGCSPNSGTSGNDACGRRDGARARH